MNEIIIDNVILCRHIVKKDIKEGLCFFSNDREYIQVGSWKYNSGKKLDKHIHNRIQRTIDRTNEVLYIVKGEIKANIYDLKGTYINSIVIREGEILILMECGHGYEILEDNTQVIEVKNGPYLGPDIDRKRF